MDSLVEDKGSSKIVHLSGDLTIQCAAELHNLLSDALSTAECVEIDLSGVADADVSCLQLLCAAHKTALQLNKMFRSDAWSPAFEEAARDASYLRHVGCTLDMGNECLWVRGRSDE